MSAGRRRAGWDPPGRQKTHKRDDLPRRLGDVITPALDRLAGGDEARAYLAWARAVGEPVSGGTRPKAFRRGQLTVECASSVWANELTYLGPQILRRMDEVAPGHPVERFRFVVGRLPARASRQEGGASDVAGEVDSHATEHDADGTGERLSGQGSKPSAANEKCPGRRPVPDAGVRARTSAEEVSDGRLRAAIEATLRPSSEGPSGRIRSRHPTRLTKSRFLRVLYPILKVDLNLRFWYACAGRYSLPPTTLQSPLGHCEVV